MGMTGEQAYVLAKKLIEAGGGGGGTVDAYTKTQTDNLLIQKVDKETGKGLFSGSYNDLSDTPTIPSKTSELKNDSGYLTEHQDLTDYAKKTDIPTKLPANGGNSDTVNNHTVKIDVPENAVFTDTIYDDTAVKGSIEKLNESLGALGKCKNLLNPTLQTTTQNGVTCTANRDGTYTLNGTASSDIVLALESYKSYTGKEKFRLVGCPNGGGESKYYLAFRPNNAEENRKDIGSGVTFNDLSTSNEYAVAIIVLNGTTVTNLTFKPMLVNLDEHPELSNITYDDFVPYTGDGDTLTHDVAGIKNDLGGLSFSVSGTTLSITDGTNTWTLSN